MNNSIIKQNGNNSNSIENEIKSKIILNESKSYDPLQSLVESYLSVDENKVVGTFAETIPGFISTSQVETPSNIDVNGKPTRSMYDNVGKYFDQYLFNQKFDQYIKDQTLQNTLKEKVKLHDLNNIENLKIKPYQLPLNKILINTKNACFQIYDDISNGVNPSKNMGGDNLFYLGILLLTITLLYVSISYIFD